MSTKKELSQKDLKDAQNKDLKDALKLTQKELTDKLNLFDFSKIKIKEKKSNDTKSKDDMYYYQFLFKKYQNKDYSILNKDEFKKLGQRLRTKIRNKRNSFANNIIFYAQNKNLIELQKEIVSFNSFYKETYILNDYSLKSISSTNRDEESTILLNMMLDIILKLK